jgi:lysophospholipid acyltransferase (LPLAT)-like uncharacterized protein
MNAERNAPRGEAAEPAAEGWRLRLALGAGLPLVRGFAATWKLHRINEGPWRALRAEKRPFVWVLWHGGMLPVTWGHRDESIAVLISSHRDGEIIARITGALGFRAIRGSSSRGAAKALLAIVRELRAGGEVAITPDGPRGPSESFAAGAVLAAPRAGVPIVAVGMAASRAWRLGSWDRFLIPKPFARVSLVYSDPSYVDAVTARDAEAEVERFRTILLDAQTRARESLGGGA